MNPSIAQAGMTDEEREERSRKLAEVNRRSLKGSGK